MVTLGCHNSSRFFKEKSVVYCVVSTTAILKLCNVLMRERIGKFMNKIILTPLTLIKIIGYQFNFLIKIKSCMRYSFYSLKELKFRTFLGISYAEAP